MTATTTPDYHPDSAAFQHAMLSASPKLRRFALRLTKDPVAADDLVQDTLTKAWAARLRFQTGTNMPAWLFRIARNGFLSGVRRARRQVAWDPDRHQSMLVQQPVQEEAIYARDLDTAWSLLPALQRSALLLVSRDGMSIEEAADRLGVPSGTVKSRISRARASILAFVEGDMVIVEKQASKTVSRPNDRPDRARTSDRREPSEAPTRRGYERWKASGITTIG